MPVAYGLKTSTFGKMWSCQKEITIKVHDEDQFGGDAIPESWARSRNDVTYWEPVLADGSRFEAIVDGPIPKRARFVAPERIIQHHPGGPRESFKNLSQTVTLYQGCPFIREDYENIVNSGVDAAVPDGMPKRTDGERNFGFVASNLDPDDITWEGRREDRETRAGRHDEGW